MWTTADRLTDKSEPGAIESLEQLRRDLDQLKGLQDQERPDVVPHLESLQIPNSRDDYPLLTDDNIFGATQRPHTTESEAKVLDIVCCFLISASI